MNALKVHAKRRVLMLLVLTAALVGFTGIGPAAAVTNTDSFVTITATCSNHYVTVTGKSIAPYIGAYANLVASPPGVGATIYGTIPSGTNTFSMKVKGLGPNVYYSWKITSGPSVWWTQGVYLSCS